MHRGMDTFPIPVWVEIFSYLDASSYKSLRATCVSAYSASCERNAHRHLKFVITDYNKENYESLMPTILQSQINGFALELVKCKVEEWFMELMRKTELRVRTLSFVSCIFIGELAPYYAFKHGSHLQALRYVSGDIGPGSCKPSVDLYQDLFIEYMQPVIKQQEVKEENLQEKNTEFVDDSNQLRKHSNKSIKYRQYHAIKQLEVIDCRWFHDIDMERFFNCLPSLETLVLRDLKDFQYNPVVYRRFYEPNFKLHATSLFHEVGRDDLLTFQFMVNHWKPEKIQKLDLGRTGWDGITGNILQYLAKIPELRLETFDADFHSNLSKPKCLNFFSHQRTLKVIKFTNFLPDNLNIMAHLLNLCDNLRELYLEMHFIDKMPSTMFDALARSKLEVLVMTDFVLAFYDDLKVSLLDRHSTVNKTVRKMSLRFHENITSTVLLFCRTFEYATDVSFFWTYSLGSNFSEETKICLQEVFNMKHLKRLCLQNIIVYEECMKISIASKSLISLEFKLCYWEYERNGNLILQETQPNLTSLNIKRFDMTTTQFKSLVECFKSLRFLTLPDSISVDYVLEKYLKTTFPNMEYYKAGEVYYRHE